MTNTGSSVVTGNLGLTPGSAVIGFPPGIVTGAVHVSDSAAGKALNDANAAYTILATTPPTLDLSGQDLGGMTLVPGVYHYATSAQLTGALALDALGNDSAVFIFQIGSTLTTAAGSSVTLINGGSGCNVFWQVGTSATLGTSSALVGNILASASITLTTTASVTGRVLALNGAVTLDTNDVMIPAECQCVISYGAGCPGTGGFVPKLSLLGCPIVGFDSTFQIEQGLGGATAALLFGGAQVAEAMPTGCILLVRPMPLVLFLSLGGTGAGNGSFSVTFTVPATATAGTVTIQAFVVDGGVPLGFSNSNGVQVIIG